MTIKTLLAHKREGAYMKNVWSDFFFDLICGIFWTIFWGLWIVNILGVIYLIIRKIA